MSDLAVVLTARAGGVGARSADGRGVVKRLGLRTSTKTGWHVVVRDVDGDEYVLAYSPFARKQDAELAKRALEVAGLSSIESIVEAGADRMIEVMYEGLAW